MLDVIHYLVEEDIVVPSQELERVRRSFRTNLYRELYNTPYIFADDEKSAGTPDAGHEGVRVQPGSRGLEAPMDAEPYPHAPQATPSYGAAAGPQRRGRVGAGVAVRDTTSVQMTHKPYIPPTDLSVGANPMAPIRGLREAPMS